MRKSHAKLEVSGRQESREDLELNQAEMASGRSKDTEIGARDGKLGWILSNQSEGLWSIGDSGPGGPPTDGVVNRQIAIARRR